MRFPRSSPATLVAACCLAVSAFALGVLPAGNALAAGPIATAKYACQGGKSIGATYYADKVEIVLSDGRSLSLPQTMSGSGIRYANADESFVFWSKGKTAFATERKAAQPTYADCVETGK